MNTLLIALGGGLIGLTCSILGYAIAGLSGQLVAFIIAMPLSFLWGYRAQAYLDR